MRTKKARYIAVEGPIGVGKSSLVTLLGERFGAEPVFEKVAENPFLESFYGDMGQYAFQTQIFFLVSRHKQLSSLSQTELFNRVTLCDYVLERDLIFARLNLSEDEFRLYIDIYNLLRRRIPKPDLVVYLQAETPTLLKRIRRRNRDIERNVSEGYIDQVNKAFNEFFFSYREGPLLIINTNSIDFVANEEDFEKLVAKVTGEVKGTEFFNPLGSAG